MAHTNSENSAPNTKLNLNIDLRIVVVALIVLILAMLVIWKPWSPATGTRTIQVSGDSTVTAKPDEYMFYPSYQFKNADKAAALADLSKKSDEITAKLKSLGVSSDKIKTDSSGNDYPIYYDDTNTTPTYTLQFTITTNNLALAQKVQDYLVTTAPTGSVSPQADFSDAKRKQLESQARDEATKNARSKGEQMAKNLGFKLGKVKDVEDGSGFGGIIPMNRGMSKAMDAENASNASLTVQPGENDLDYTVTVTYFIH